MAAQIPIIRRSWQWSRLKNSNGLKTLISLPGLARSSICMPGIIVLVMNCHQSELYEAIFFFEDIQKIDVSKYRTLHIDGH